MMVQVKPVVLTILVGTIAACNVTKPITISIYIICLLIIHTPILDAVAFQLELAKSSPPHPHTKVAAQIVTDDDRGTPSPADLEISSIISTTKSLSVNNNNNNKPPSQQQETNPDEQLCSDIEPSEKQPTSEPNKKSKKNKKKSKALKKPAVSLQSALDQQQDESTLPKPDLVASTAPIVDTEDVLNEGGWSLVSKKRRITKPPASERNGANIGVCRVPQESGERNLVLRKQQFANEA